MKSGIILLYAMRAARKYYEYRDRAVRAKKNMGMNRRQFAEYFGIPYRTVQDWELGNRKMPEYLLRLIEYKAKVEKML